jgi:hypothetical protein
MKGRHNVREKSTQKTSLRSNCSVTYLRSYGSHLARTIHTVSLLHSMRVEGAYLASTLATLQSKNKTSIGPVLPMRLQRDERAQHQTHGMM